MNVLAEIGHLQVTHHEGYSTSTYDNNRQLFDPPLFQTLQTHAEESLAGRLLLGGTEHAPAEYPDSAAFVKTLEEQLKALFLQLFSEAWDEEQQAATRREAHLQKLIDAFTEAHTEKPFCFTRITDYVIYQRE